MPSPLRPSAQSAGFKPMVRPSVRGRVWSDLKNDFRRAWLPKIGLSGLGGLLGYWMGTATADKAWVSTLTTIFGLVLPSLWGIVRAPSRIIDDLCGEIDRLKESEDRRRRERTAQRLAFEEQYKKAIDALAENAAEARLVQDGFTDFRPKFIDVTRDELREARILLDEVNDAASDISEGFAKKETPARLRRAAEKLVTSCKSATDLLIRIRGVEPQSED